MSGGVDSSVAAGLLVDEGHQVEGVSLRLWESGTEDPRNCSDCRGARGVADVLGIRHTVLDLTSQFFERVVGPFARSYLRGLTPNPCVACNHDFKLGALMEWARKQGADYVATGHYARVERDSITGRAFLSRGVHRQKDQSYFLFALSQEQLAHTLFPLGSFTKGDVRLLATRFGLPVADRPESQDICLGNYQALVESFAEEGDLRSGEIVDRGGTVLGRHQGIHRLTVGQRRGLGVSAPQPLYVLEIDDGRRQVVVGRKEELGRPGFLVHSVNWIEPPEGGEVVAEVQLRYRSAVVPCRLQLDQESTGTAVRVEFLRSAHPVTPGQAAVFYRGERVLGGGWILQGLDENRSHNARL